MPYNHDWQGGTEASTCHGSVDILGRNRRNCLRTQDQHEKATINNAILTADLKPHPAHVPIFIGSTIDRSVAIAESAAR